MLQEAVLALPVKFSCYVVNTPEGILAGQVVKEQWSEGGLQMEIELLEFGTALAKYNNFEHTCFQIGWSGRPDPDGNTDGFLHSKAGLNREQYANPKVDELMGKERAVYDQAERKKILRRSAQACRKRSGNRLSLLAVECQSLFTAREWVCVRAGWDGAVQISLDDEC